MLPSVTDLESGRARDGDQGIVGDDPQMEDLELLAVIGLLADAFDDPQALIRVNDLIAYLERFHSNPLYRERGGGVNDILPEAP
jgi:hypothetical protein